MPQHAVQSDGRAMRAVVLVLTLLQLAVFAYVESDFLLRAGSMDMLTRSINRDFAVLAIVPVAALTLPALVLALINRWLPLALALAVMPVVFALGIAAMLFW